MMASLTKGHRPSKFQMDPLPEIREACENPPRGPNSGWEVGGGRTTRQPGQVRKEAALTRPGGSLSSLPLSPFSLSFAKFWLCRAGGPGHRAWDVRCPSRTLRPERFPIAWNHLRTPMMKLVPGLAWSLLPRQRIRNRQRHPIAFLPANIAQHVSRI
jgi:hypothetical protein